MRSRSPIRFRTYGPELILDALEERIVLDASAAPTTQDHHDNAADNHAVQQTGLATDPAGQNAAAGHVDASANPSQSTAALAAQVFNQDLKVVLVSNALDHVDTIAQAAKDNAKVIVVDANKDTLVTIEHSLENLVQSTGQKIGTLAVVAHGKDGAIEIGADNIQLANFFKYESGLKSLSNVLAEGAQIQFYGCSVAGDAAGQSLLGKIADDTHATVFASTNTTGGAGHDWNLEFSTTPGTPMYVLLDTAKLGNIDQALSFTGAWPLSDPNQYKTYWGSVDVNDPVGIDGRHAEFWKFYGTAGETVSVGMQTTRPDLGYGVAPNIDTFLEVYNPDGTQAAQIDDWKSPPGTGNNPPYSIYSDSLLQWKLPQTGWYVVQACTWNLGDYGDYSLISTKDMVEVPGNNIQNKVDYRTVPDVTVPSTFTSYTYDMADFFGKPLGTTPVISYALGTLGGTLGAGTYTCGIDSATGLIMVTHTGTGSGTLTVPVTATDGGTSGSWTFTLNVAAGNSAPYLENGGLPNINVWPGDSLSKTIDLKTYFHDWEDGDNLTYNNPTPTVTDPNAVLTGWSVDNVNKTLTLNYSSTGQGTATIAVTGKDSGGLSVAETFTVTAKLNEPALQNIGFDTGNTTGWTTDAGYTSVINNTGTDGFISGTKMLQLDQNNSTNNFPSQVHQEFKWNGEKIQVGYDFFTYDAIGYDHFGYTINLNGTPIAYLNRDAGWSGHTAHTGNTLATTGWITDPVVDPAAFGAHTGDVIAITLYAGNDVTGTQSSSYANFDLQLVTAPNPVSKGIADIEVIEDSADSVLNLFNAFYDAQTLPANMTYKYTITSTDNTSLFAHVDGAAPPNNTPVTIVNPSAFDLDYGPNQAGYANIKITATDTDNHAIDYTFKVTVRPVNDLPTSGPDQSLVVETGQYQDITFTGHDPELFATTSEKFATNYSGTGTLASQGTVTSLGGGDYSQVWRYTPNANFYGPETFQYAASTPSGTWKGFETGQGTTITKPSATQDGTNDMQLADLNHDGYLDLVEANQQGTNGNGYANYFYLNDGTGHFLPGVQMGTDTSRSVRLVLADINNDGYVDAVVANTNNTSDYVYTWNSTTNKFNNGVALTGTNGYGTTAVALGDFNGDGWRDIAIATNDNPGRLIMFLNSGSGTFGTGKVLPTLTGQIGAIGVGDFNGDGYVDIVVGKDGTADDLIYLNNGTGSFTNILHLPSAGRGNTTYLAVGDVDGDHNVDVVMGGNGLNRFYKNNGSGSFSYYKIGSTDADNTASIRLADLNKDGYLDVVAFNDFNGTTPQVDKYYLYNAGTTNPYQANGTAIESAAIGDRAGVLGDVNKDGNVDLIMGIYTTTNNPNVGGAVNDRVFLNQGFNYSTLAQSPDPATINVQTELIKNSGFETGDLGVNAWHVDERTTQDDPNVLALVGVVTNNTTIDMTTNAGGPVTIKDLVNNDYPPQLWAWVGAQSLYPQNASITVNDPTGGAGDHILVSLDNGPRKDMIYQDVVIPNDPSVTQYTVAWKMAYWNQDFFNNNPQFHTAAERQPQYISLYVYDPTKPIPSPVWTTVEGTSFDVVPTLQNYSAIITNPALRGTKVRIGLEVFSGDNFLQVAVDDFHINPTRTIAPTLQAGLNPAVNPPYFGQPVYLQPPPAMAMASAASADTGLTMTLDSSGPTIVPVLEGLSATGSSSLVSVIEQQAAQTSTASAADQGTASVDQVQPASVSPTSSVDTGQVQTVQQTVVVPDTTQATTAQTVVPATQQAVPDVVVPPADQTAPPPVEVLLAGGFDPELNLSASMVFDPNDLSSMNVIALSMEMDSAYPATATAELQHLAMKLAGGQSGAIDLDAVRFTDMFA